MYCIVLYYARSSLLGNCLSSSSPLCWTKRIFVPPDFMEQGTWQGRRWQKRPSREGSGRSMGRWCGVDVSPGQWLQCLDASFFFGGRCLDVDWYLWFSLVTQIYFCWPSILWEEMQPLHPRPRWNRAAKNNTTLYAGIGLQKVTDLKGSNECLRIKWRVHHSFKQNWSHRFASSLGDCISWCRLGSTKKVMVKTGEEGWLVPSFGKR